MFRCAAYWEHLRFKAPALPLASCGISESPLPFPVPLCSYLQNEGIALASPRQLVPVMPGGFKCLRSGWRDVRGKHEARERVARLGNEPISRSREDGGETNPEKEFGATKWFVYECSLLL